jgi:ABC-type phosphate/phosphonate transport system substrate-binding protein
MIRWSLPGGSTINRFIRIVWLFLGLMLVLWAGSACSGRSREPVSSYTAPTRVPTITPLPPLPTIAPAGSANNPLVLTLVTDDREEMASGADALAASLSDGTGLTVELRLVTSYNEALRSLCDGSSAGAALDAFGYLAAVGEGCGSGLYRAEIDGQAAEVGQLVADAGRVFTLVNFPDRVFCRVDALSAYGWLTPMLIMEANGIDPYQDLAGIVDAGTDAEVLRLIAEGTCDTGATRAGAEAALDDPASVDIVQMLPPIPYETFLLSNRLTVDQRALLTDILRQNQGGLASLMHADNLAPFSDEDFTDLQSLLAASGIDLLVLSK